MKINTILATVALSLALSVNANAMKPEPEHNIKSCLEYKALSQMMLMGRQSNKSKEGMVKALKGEGTPFMYDIINVIYDAPWSSIRHPNAASDLGEAIFDVCMAT